MAQSPLLSWIIHILTLISLARAFSQLSDSSLKAIPDPGSDFDIKTGKILSPILRTRVPGTEGSTAVLNHFASFFRTSLPAWNISFQNSSTKVSIMDNKEYPFVNFIATRDPPWSQPGEVGYLTLVAHYDSKLEPDGFIGAIDSAAPCAMIMHAARSLEGMLTKKWADVDKVGIKVDDFSGDLEAHKGIQIIFLDGEEAFGTWTNTDSIYGSKSLAKEMEETYHPALSTYHNALSSISLFLLLDLLGSASPSIPSFFKTTHWAYRRMATLAQRLRYNQKFKSENQNPWFPDHDKDDQGRWMGGAIEDDHIPFMARGVDVLHMIPAPFPSVWHRIEDDGEHLDRPTCEDWAVLITAFAAEWMDLEGYLDTSAAPVGKRQEDGEKTLTSRTEL